MELLNQLGINWKLLIGQLINFLVLFFVLKRFVFKPVIEMLEKRTHTIQKGLHDAKAADERLTQIEQMHKERMAATDKEIGRMLETARGDAETVRKEILAHAQMQSDDLLKRTRLQVEEEKVKMLQDVKREVGTFVIDLTSKLLKKEISPADQKRLADAIAQEMKTAL